MFSLYPRTRIIPALLLGAAGCLSQACSSDNDTLPGQASSTGLGSSAATVPGTTSMGTMTSSAASSSTGSLPPAGSQGPGSTTPSDATGTTGSEPAPEASDNFLWLEAIDAERSMRWVKQQNLQSTGELTAIPGFMTMQTKLESILSSSGQIPTVQKIGDHVYNLWKDGTNPRGLWRKTTLESYRSKDPQWTTVLDLDQLARDERENWVWKRAQCLSKTNRCMLALSRGGKDAVVHREFDVSTASFVKDGFFMPEAKGQISWVNQDQLLFGTNLGAGSTTESGYPRQIRRWNRGTDIGSSKVVFEIPRTNSMVRAYHVESKGVERDYIMHTINRYEYGHYLLSETDEPIKLQVPSSCRLSFWGPFMLIELKQDWEQNGTVWPQGSLLVADQAKFLAGDKQLTALFTPQAGRSLQALTKTKDHLLLTEMQDVKSRLREWSYSESEGWKGRDVKVPESGSFRVRSFDKERDNAYTFTYSDFLTPPTLHWARSGTDLREALYSLPKAFDASNLEVQQHFATSQDGTKIPYFQISQKGLALNGTNPTILYGYGGFQISLRPKYDPTLGSAWLQKGGVYVVANIRGGGEYGPAWHQAALRDQRPRAYEDFVAVGQDLVTRKVTQAKHLGVMGRSNGGLLTGVMLTQHPQMWGAVVSQVPLLDMKRYNKLLAGALWQGEYGNPDLPEDWAFLSKYSPYHNIPTGQTLPPALFTTSTKDDRVHPAHARKMVARLHEQGYTQAKLYENIEGGHGGAANSQQKAYLEAMVYGFLAKSLGLALR